MLVYIVLFIVPMLISFFFSLTHTSFDLADWEYIGLKNFETFFSESNMMIGFKNTIIYAVTTSGLKTILGLILGAFLCSSLNLKSRPFLRSMIFFPTLLSTLAVGVTFKSLFHPTKGLINQFIGLFGVKGPDWLGNVNLALGSVIFVDVWKGLGIATVIYIAGIMAIDNQYYEALQIDGGNWWQKFWSITVPLSRPAMNSVIILSFISGLRTFDLVFVMTGGGPGFTTELMASTIWLSPGHLHLREPRTGEWLSPESGRWTGAPRGCISRASCLFCPRLHQKSGR